MNLDKLNETQMKFIESHSRSEEILNKHQNDLKKYIDQLNVNLPSHYKDFVNTIQSKHSFRRKTPKKIKAPILDSSPLPTLNSIKKRL